MAGSVVSIIALFGFFQAWAILPHRVATTERSISVLQDDSKRDREVLIRIEERLKAFQAELNKKLP